MKQKLKTFAQNIIRECQSDRKKKFQIVSILSAGTITILIVLVMISMLLFRGHSSRDVDPAHKPSSISQNIKQQDDSQMSLAGQISDEDQNLHYLDDIKESVGKQNIELQHQLNAKLDSLNDVLSKTFELANKNNKQQAEALQHEVQSQLQGVVALLTKQSKQVNAKLDQVYKLTTKIHKDQLASLQMVLSEKVLPFKVINVDWWNGQQKVSVRNKGDGNYALLTVGQKYHGWLLNRINQHGQNREIIFTNNKQKVVVSV